MEASEILLSNFTPEALEIDMNSSEQGSSGLGFLLVVGCSMVLAAYVLFVQKDSSLNWILLFLLAAAYPVVQLVEHRVRHKV
jgi:hypothetical protein